MRTSLLCALSALALSPELAAADPQPQPFTPSASSWPTLTDAAQDGTKRFARDLRGTFNGRKIDYRATLEETIIKDRAGKPASSIYTTSFVARAAKEAAPRPVLFIFNGGPGAAANTLMFGAFGPKRVTSMTPEAMADPATPVVDNPWSPLDAADLVFIDPPETGFGLPLPGSDPLTFRSNDGDSYAVGQFILHWLNRNGRSASPIYLAGESYGTLRAVMLARDLLAASPRVEVSGIVLISQAIYYNGPASFGVKRPPEVMRSIGRLPDVAALAWYYGLIDNRGQTLEQAMTSARAFAHGRYATALIEGNRLSDEERHSVAAELSHLVGLPPSYFLDRGLLLGDPRSDLLASRGLALDQFDGRETEPLDKVVADADRDWENMLLGLTTAMQDYVKGTLGGQGLPPYRSIVPDPYGFEETWKYIAPPQAGLEIVLQEQLRANPRLRVMVPMGVFDTTSSVGITENMFAQHGFPRDRVSLIYYPGGHMLYSDIEGLKAFNADVRSFMSGKDLSKAPFPQPKPAK